MYNKVKMEDIEMDFKELNVLEELQHEHPLTLVDLQLMLRDYEEDDEDYDEEELIKTQKFKSTCSRCKRQIDWYHRYYYKCSMSSCSYSLHKFCKEIPTSLKFQGHPLHTLILIKITNDEKCHGCFKHHREGICYYCSTCDYGIDLLCATFVEQNTIHHPGHSHPLISVSVEPILSKCFACGKKHEGHFYHCVTCFKFSINFDCLSLPIKLSLRTQQFSHRHLLTLSYSILDQLYDCECRICGLKLEDEFFNYMCSKCMYYAHPDCAIQTMEPFMSILSPGLGKGKKNYEDVDHPKLLHFPLDDESPILSHAELMETCFEESFYVEGTGFVYGKDMIKVTNTSSVSLHDPMKRSKVLCTACSRPITTFPFYQNHSRDVIFHDWCFRLPKEVAGHPHDHGHTLWRHNHTDYDGRKCDFCGLPFNGFAYICCEGYCIYIIDVNCAFIPEEITHEAHANHLLTRVDHHAASSSRQMECRACREGIEEGKTYFRCNACDFCLDCRCALHLPKSIRNKCDKHPLQLSYSPVEDYKSEYFCEVCEEGLDPGKWFYHCVECAQSIHSACAPLILQSEQGVNSFYLEGVYKFINTKFGVTQCNYRNDHDEGHPMTFAPGTENDGLCKECGSKLQSNMIWKGLLSGCHFGVHHRCSITPFLGPLLFNINQPRFDYGGTKRMKTHRPKTNMGFYPTQITMMRPVTRHYEVIDDDDIS